MLFFCSPLKPDPQKNRQTLKNFDYPKCKALFLFHFAVSGSCAVIMSRTAKCGAENMPLQKRWFRVIIYKVFKS
jgi:hypothetical protein